MNSQWRMVMASLLGICVVIECAAQQPRGDRPPSGDRDRSERREGRGMRDEGSRRERRMNRDGNENREGNRGGGPAGRPSGPPSGGGAPNAASRNPAPSSAGGGGDPAARVGTYAKSLLSRYDENKNGSLEKDEWSRMRSTHAAADANHDGIISLQELTQHLRGFSSESSSSTSKPATPNRATATNTSNRSSPNDKKAAVKKDDRASYRFLTAKERVTAQLPGTLKDWFLENDKNADGQIAMSEFSTSWSTAKVDEFRKLDPNNDGRITPQEYLRVKSPSSKK